VAPLQCDVISLRDHYHWMIGEKSRAAFSSICHPEVSKNKLLQQSSRFLLLWPIGERFSLVQRYEILRSAKMPTLIDIWGRICGKCIIAICSTSSLSDSRRQSDVQIVATYYCGVLALRRGLHDNQNVLICYNFTLCDSGRHSGVQIVKISYCRVLVSRRRLNGNQTF
jgi:hypothetical protein